ncbi:MAG: ATP-binding cassette domain-containing protein [Demequina sp.]
MLKGASLTVKSGESCAIMAPSGEGKSTLLSIAGALLVPERGRVSHGPGSNARDQVTWIFQGPSVLVRRTALDNVTLPLVARGASHTDARGPAREALTRVGLEMDVDRPVRQLSGGQAQRVAIARALVTSPAVVLADEPTASLDFETGRSVCAALLETMAGSAILIATHDVRIARMADRLVRLENGVIVEAAT